MTAQEAFMPILDNDEKIVESFKPHKFRFIGLGIIGDFLKSLIFVAFGLVAVLLSFCDMTTTTTEIVDGVEKVVEEPTNPWVIRGIGLGVIGFAVLLILIAVVWRIIKYRKTWFCYTNKRIIIRTGFIGADFQTLDFDMIGAMNVRVDFLDKFIHPNTGTLMFASAASPMMANGMPGGVSGYMFVDIENPYDVYKRVKEYSSKNRDGKFNS